MLQVVAVKYSGLQWIAVGCSGLQWAAVGCSRLHNAAVRRVFEASNIHIVESYPIRHTLQKIETHCNKRQEYTHTPHRHSPASHILDPEPVTHSITLQHTATHCNTLQHTATHCNTLQHTASQTHCNTLQHTATTHTHNSHSHARHMFDCEPATQCNALQHTATHCNTLQQHCYTLQQHCNTHTHQPKPYRAHI